MCLAPDSIQHEIILEVAHTIMDLPPHPTVSYLVLLSLVWIAPIIFATRFNTPVVNTVAFAGSTYLPHLHLLSSVGMRRAVAGINPLRRSPLFSVYHSGKLHFSFILQRMS